jgi:hypothetical protein
MPSGDEMGAGIRTPPARLVRRAATTRPQDLRPGHHAGPAADLHLRLLRPVERLERLRRPRRAARTEARELRRPGVREKLRALPLKYMFIDAIPDTRLHRETFSEQWKPVKASASARSPTRPGGTSSTWSATSSLADGLRRSSRRPVRHHARGRQGTARQPVHHPGALRWRRTPEVPRPPAATARSTDRGLRARAQADLARGSALAPELASRLLRRLPRSRHAARRGGRGHHRLRLREARLHLPGVRAGPARRRVSRDQPRQRLPLRAGQRRAHDRGRQAHERALGRCCCAHGR